MRRFARLTAWVAVATATLAALLLAAAWLLLGTDTGRTALERAVDRGSGGYVRLAGLGGRFPRHLTLERLMISDARGVWLTAERIDLTWSPWGLVSRRIEIDRLRVQRLRIERAPASGTTAGGGVSPHVEVADAEIRSLELGAALVGRQALLRVAGAARLRSLEDGDARLEATRLDAPGDYRLTLRVDPTRLDAALRVAEPAAGPLQTLLGMPGLGALHAAAGVAGPRTAARVVADLDAGSARAHAGGTVDLAARRMDLDVKVDSGAQRPNASFAWRFLSARLRLHGRWRAPDADGVVELRGLELAGGTAADTVHADLRGGGGTLAAQARIEGLRVAGPQPLLFARAPLTVRLDWQLDAVGRPLRAELSHPLVAATLRAVTAAPRSVEVDASLPDLAPLGAFLAQDARGSASLHAHIDESARGWRFAANAQARLSGTAAWVAPLGGRVRVQVEGESESDVVRLDRAQLLVPAGSLSIAGALMPRERRVDASWQLTLADLARFTPALAGTAEASGRLRGAFDALQIDARLAATASVHGSPPGKLTATAGLRGWPRDPSAQVTVGGVLDEAPFDLDLALQRSGGRTLRLAVRRAQWKSAEVAGDLDLDSSLEHPRGRLHLQIGRLADLRQVTGAELEGVVDGDLAFTPGAGGTDVALRVAARDVAAGGLHGAAQVTAAGRLPRLAVGFAAQSPALFGAAAALTGHGTVDVASRELRLAQAEFDLRKESVRLERPVNVSVAQGVQIDSLVLRAGTARLSIAGRLTPSLDASVALDGVHADLIDAFLPGVVRTVTVSGDARLTGTASAPTGAVHLDAAGLRFAGEAGEGLPPAQLALHAELAGDATALDARLRTADGSELALDGHLPWRSGADLDLKLHGAADLKLANAWLEAGGLRVDGRLGVDATLTGQWQAPVLGGNFTLTDGDFRDYGRGVEFSHVSAVLTAADRTLTIRQCSANAAAGTVTLAGSLGVLEPGMPLDVVIKARKAQPVASAIVTSTLDADLTVRGRLRERIDVAGTITLDRTLIGIPNSLPPNVAVLDVRRRGTATAHAVNPLVIGLDLRVSAPREVLVQGRGLDAELSGQLRIRGTADEPAVGGGFDLQRGSFTLAGRRLDITSGRVGFDGAGLRRRIDPTLDFTAQVALSDTTAKLVITGHADSPQFSLTSAPTVLPPDEIMCRLLFGQCAAQPTALQAAQIGAALATMSGIGDGSLNPLVRLQRSLGLDRLSVGSASPVTGSPGESSGAAIQAGRYVTRRIYVQGTQSTTGNSQVEVDVDLTKHLQLKTRLGNGTAVTQGTTPENDPGSSIGLSYTFEY